MRLSARKHRMYFSSQLPPASTYQPGTTTDGATTRPTAEPMDTDAPAASHPGMPPAGVTDGNAPSYGYANAAAMDWRADMPELAGAWAAIEKLASQKVLNSDFGAIDARNQLMAALGMPRAVVDKLRYEDADGKARQKTANAIHAFAASSNPDTTLLDRPHPPFDLLGVLSMLDVMFVRGCGNFLAPIVTLLALRQAGAGNRYDAAVIAQHAGAFAKLSEASAKAEETQYAATQDLRKNFVRDAAMRQAAYRQLHDRRVAPDTGHLPHATQQALGRLSDAYGLDMNLMQKTEILNTLEAVFGVPTEASDDISAPLEQLLRWYENPMPNVAPPPPAVLMGLVVAVGWHDYQDGKSLREGRSVKLTLTGHPALPDALTAALLHYLPAQTPSLSLMGATAPPPSADHAVGPAAAHLRQMLVLSPTAGPRRIAQLIECSIASTGQSWIERLKNDPAAVYKMKAELQAVAQDAAQRAVFDESLTSLTDVMREIVTSSNPLYLGFMLDLYRALGVAASDLSRATRLNTVFYKHPEISPAAAQELTERFAQGMLHHGYSEPQAAALKTAARALRLHWNDSAATRVCIEQLHEKALDAVLEVQVSTANETTGPNPDRLGVAPAPKLLESLIDRCRFTDEMLRKLGNDLNQLQLYGSVATRIRMEKLYRQVLNPDGGSMAGAQMAAAIRRLSGAITTHLANAPDSIGGEVATAFATLGGPGLPATDLYQLLRYFWRLDATLPDNTPVAALRELLDKLKNDRCFAGGGEIDLARVCEFNNAAREKIVEALTERVPGFGVAYANALSGTAGKDYGEVMMTMQAMLDHWNMPERSY